MQGVHSLLVVAGWSFSLGERWLQTHPQRLGFIFKWEKRPWLCWWKKAKRIVTLVVLVFCKFTLKSLLFVSKACLSVLSGRIMRSLSVSLSLSHESQSIWFYANKRGAGPIKSLCVRGAPPHTLSEVLQSKRRERERESVSSLITAFQA